MPTTVRGASCGPGVFRGWLCEREPGRALGAGAGALAVLPAQCSAVTISATRARNRTAPIGASATRGSTTNRSARVLATSVR